MRLKINDELPTYEVATENYALQSSNKIHSPEVAQKLGFTGGLVPGVGIYSYMTQPFVEHLGKKWLERGFMHAKFLNPIYDKEVISVRCKVIAEKPLTINIEVLNSEGALCAIGTGGFIEQIKEPRVSDYPLCPLPAFDDRFPARADALELEVKVGSAPIAYHPDDTEVYYFKKIRDQTTELSNPEPLHHPSFFLHIANRLTASNIDLGPWIHTASEVQHFNLPVMSANMQLNGKIIDAYARRGHDFVVLDLAVFTDSEIPIATIKHTAIIRPKGI